MHVANIIIQLVIKDKELATIQGFIHSITVTILDIDRTHGQQQIIVATGMSRESKTNHSQDIKINCTFV